MPFDGFTATLDIARDTAKSYDWFLNIEGTMDKNQQGPLTNVFTHNLESKIERNVPIVNNDFDFKRKSTEFLRVGIAANDNFLFIPLDETKQAICKSIY